MLTYFLPLDDFVQVAMMVVLLVIANTLMDPAFRLTLIMADAAKFKDVNIGYESTEKFNFSLRVIKISGSISASLKGLL